jgi:hypothetical protein
MIIFNDVAYSIDNDACLCYYADPNLKWFGLYENL